MVNGLFRKKEVADILAQVQESSKNEGDIRLKKHLKVRDLTAFGIAAIIGAGIFSTIGQASYQGGPAVIFLFLFTAVACGFAAFAYAEFASIVPASGSAYTYSYVAFGEIIAWIIGWALIMEYAIGNVTVAISWSGYFTDMLSHIRISALGIEGIHIPLWAQMDYFTALNGHSDALTLLESGKTLKDLKEFHEAIWCSYEAYQNSPTIGGFHVILDLPALFIIVAITALVYRGIKESRNASNAMVIIKLAVILLVLGVGIFYIDPTNWSPFAPNGIGGILKGVSAVFFAYIGFDAISTTAEECENPQRDLPRGMMWAIIVCTFLYIAVALVLTGIVSYKYLNKDEPLSFVFQHINLTQLSGIISISAVVAMASVLLVFQMGQPRIWMSMSRDGLLPKRFSKLHPKYKTPSFATIVVGFVVAIPTLFLSSEMVTDLCSIGTLFAFVLVCGGVLMLQNRTDIPRGKFKTPYLNGKYVLPFLIVGALVIIFTNYKQEALDFMTNKEELKSRDEIVQGLNPNEILFLKNHLILNDGVAFRKYASNINDFYVAQGTERLVEDLKILKLPKSHFYRYGWRHFLDKIPTWIFILFTLFIAVMTHLKNLSTIPLLGLLSCLYMMSEIKAENWFFFSIWLLIGLVIYFSYGRKHSKLASAERG
ncbi:MAG: amino acid permease [Bacteroidetes bacterium]|nr:amino acid permease [Bacteroidota bacterium]MBM3424959.1 amino acid permease [Bacteroidota bacterium]